MNEQLQVALAEIINKSMNGIDAATGFLADEIPDVVYQLLMWHGVYNLLITLLGIAVLVATGICIVKFTGRGELIDPQKGDFSGNYRETITHDSDGDLNEHCPVAIFFVLPFAAGCIMVNLEWLKIWIAPKVWLLEYAANLAK